MIQLIIIFIISILLFKVKYTGFKQLYILGCIKYYEAVKSLLKSKYRLYTGIFYNEYNTS